jgi:preprotein translocase subunit YajC
MNQEMPNSIYSFLLPVIIFVTTIFIFTLPQKKREKMKREMLSTLTTGMEVVTVGGVIGKIVNIKDDEITIESSIEKTQLKLCRWAIREIINTDQK